jgi:HK97 family phage prohead protease
MQERRFSMSVRAEGSEHKPVLVGRCAVFNSRSKPIYTRAGSYFYERLAPNCFTRALRKDNTIACLFHDARLCLGTVRAGTLQLAQDEKGLSVRCEINPEVSYARDAWHNAQSRSLSAMSFSFNVPSDGSGEEWGLEDDSEDEDERGIRSRRITDIEDLSDVAFLTQGTGAYDEASCDARMLWPDGTPSHVEARSAGSIAVPKVVNVVNDENVRRRAAIRKMQGLLK